MEDAFLRLAENAVVLRKICSKPIPPTRNDLVTADNRKDRTLRLRDELEIANCISYLANYSDQPSQAMAVCVEELSDKNSMVISAATNTGSTSDLEGGLREMASILEKQNIG